MVSPAAVTEFFNVVDNILREEEDPILFEKEARGECETRNECDGHVNSRMRNRIEKIGTILCFIVIFAVEKDQH